MPSKNSIKLYAENSYYHIYNRGIDKRTVFVDNDDYQVFLNLIKRYLIPPIKEDNKKNFEIQDKVGPRRIRYRTDLCTKIRLISFCLMPNHFHLMVKQNTKYAITDFMRALSNSYVIYFNNKYKRTGPLFTGKYKAVLVEEDSYLLHLTRYIHLNPLGIGYTGSDLAKYPYSSLKYYLNGKQDEWIHPEDILSFFKSPLKEHSSDQLSYQSFLDDYSDDSEDILADLTLE